MNSNSYEVKKTLESDLFSPEVPAFHPIDGFSTTFSFKLSSIPGPLDQIGWKDINFIGEYHWPT